LAGRSLSGRRALLANVRSGSRHRVGRCGVEPEQLEPLVREELAGTGAVDAYLIDEVGKMELFCPAFVEAVPRLLDGAVPVVLTVLLREDRDFHTTQMAEAAFRQHGLLRGAPAGGNVLVAAARYLAAHAPTVRAQGQTYQTARRLQRGERLHDEG
jgi:hypothetical protein